MTIDDPRQPRKVNQRYPYPFRGDTLGGPCAILSCPEIATTEVLWGPEGRWLKEGAVCYCEADARRALARAEAVKRAARIIDRIPDPLQPREVRP